jgi:hypothetical protein
MRFYLFFALVILNSMVRGQNIGIGISLVPESTLYGFQARGAYNASEKVSVSGTFNYYFKKNSNFSIDLDAQFKILTISEVKISPIAGINIGKVAGNLSTGLQLGLFIEIPRDGVDLYVEPKAILDQQTVIALAGGFYF